MQVIAERPFAAAVAAFLQQWQQVAAELIDGMNIFRKLIQMLSQQLLKLILAQVDARRRRFLPEGLTGFVPDQAGLDCAVVTLVNLCQFDQGQSPLNV